MQTPHGRILIVDDDEEILELLSDRLEADGYEVLTASSGSEGVQRMRANDPDLVLLDLQLPDADGFSVLTDMHWDGQHSTVIMISAYGTVDRAVESMRQGAFDFIQKPFDVERVKLAVEKGIEHDRLRRKNLYYRELARDETPSFIAESPAMKKVVDMAQRAAASSATMLLLGESGTGKEVLARAIHHWSERRDQPYLAVNCVALAENLLESELFGHEKGAFTGAVRQRKGKFEMARGGTLLLDEIGATSMGLQLKLLRVLQEGAFERVGGEQLLRADVRIIAATNRNLEKEVEEGRFLADLYYRLNVVPVKLPPLRDRAQDIPALAHFFLNHLGRETHHEKMDITSDALWNLQMYSWPGNVRELENAIERAVVLSERPEIGVMDLPEFLRGNKGESGDQAADLKKGYHNLVEENKVRVIELALKQCDGNQTRAAELLGLQRTYLVRLMKQLGMR